MVTNHSDGPPEKQHLSKLVPKSTQKNQQIENSPYKDRQVGRKTDSQTDRGTRSQKVKRKVKQTDKQQANKILPQCQYTVLSV